MEREIKFRHWNGEKMDYDPSIKVTGQRWCSVNDHFTVDMNPDNVDIIMQYTGLRDKNGKEVYEGDIVFIESSLNADLNQNGIVGWELCRFYIRAFNGYWVPDMPEAGLTITVVGNIYENKDLLSQPPPTQPSEAPKGRK